MVALCLFLVQVEKSRGTAKNRDSIPRSVVVTIVTQEGFGNVAPV
jgi:hypothetical protein